MVQNQVTVKGVVDPQVVCSRIQKRTLRRAKVLAPLPPAEGDYKPDAVPPQVSHPTSTFMYMLGSLLHPRITKQCL